MRISAAALAAVAAFCAASVGRAEPIPPPKVEFEVEGTLTTGGATTPATMRHREGRLRMDATVLGEQAALHLDRHARNAVAVFLRGGQTFAMEMDAASVGGVVTPWEVDAMRYGVSEIAGEECVDYEFAQAVGPKLQVCVTPDGVPLRSVELSQDRATWIATKVTRVAQDPAWFVVPDNAIRLQMPPMAPRR